MNLKKTFLALAMGATLMWAQSTTKTTSPSVRAPAPQSVANPSQRELAAASVALLNGGLRIRIPSGAVIQARRAGIMAAEASADEESRVVVDYGPERMVLMVYETFSRASSDFEGAVKKEIGSTSKKVEVWSLQRPLRGVAHWPNTKSWTAEANPLMGLYVLRSDRTVQHLVFLVNPAAARELEAWESLARKITASVSEGETSLARQAPRELRFEGLAVTAPDGYVATNDRGPDFSVYHLHKMTEFGEPPCSLNVYLGGYPKALPTGPLVKTSDAVLFGASAQWRETVRTFPAGYTENSEPVISTEAIFLLRRGPPPLYAHIFLESGNSAQTDELKQIAASLRLTPQSYTLATHPEGSVGITRTQIRVRNSSDVDFTDVEVGGKKYGDVKAGATTGYEEVWETSSVGEQAMPVVLSRSVTR